tara:strand:- start:453 stop:719 length:267 start_codon:yes stop_codon:yes gene_type:complete
MVRVYCPTSGHVGESRHTKGSMRGKGIGTMLLDGGMGGGSSYESVNDYIATTGRNPNISGGSLGGKITEKLGNLSVGRVKPKNIKFNL